MKRQILILEQQSWSGGAQRVLEVVLSSIGQDFKPVVAFPERGPFSTALQERHIETLTLPLGKFCSSNPALHRKDRIDHSPEASLSGLHQRPAVFACRGCGGMAHAASVAVSLASDSYTTT